MKKKIISFLLIGLVVVGFTLNYVEADDINNKLSKDNIIKTALQNNMELEMLQDKIELAEKEYKHFKENENEYIQDKVEREKNKKLESVTKKQNIEDLKSEKDNKSDEVYIEVLRAYYEISIKNNMIELQKSIVESMEKNLVQNKRNYEEGNLSKLALEEYEINVQQSNAKLDNLKNERKKLVMDLNYYLGKPLSDILDVNEDKVPFDEYTVENIDDTIIKVLEKEYSIKTIEKDIEHTKIEKEILEKYDGERDSNNNKYDFEDDIAALEDKLISLNYDLQDKKVDLEYNIRSNYNNIVKYKNEVMIKEIDYNIKEKQYEAGKVRYDLGYITELQLTQLEEDCNKALQDYEFAKLDYLITVEEFKNLINEE